MASCQDYTFDKVVFSFGYVIRLAIPPMVAINWILAILFLMRITVPWLHSQQTFAQDGGTLVGCWIFVLAVATFLDQILKALGQITPLRLGEIGILGGLSWTMVYLFT